MQSGSETRPVAFERSGSNAPTKLRDGREEEGGVGREGGGGGGGGREGIHSSLAHDSLGGMLLITCIHVEAMCQISKSTGTHPSEPSGWLLH